MKNSQRLIYTELSEADFELFWEVNSSEEIMHYAYMDKFETKEQARKSFDSVLALQTDENEGTQFVVRKKNTNEPIGIVDFFVILKHPSGGIYEIGYFMIPKFWECGYGIEMANAITEHLFSELNAHKIVASCSSQNKNSESIMKKLNMKKEGNFRESRYKNNKWEDEIKYGIMRHEWLSGKK